MAPQGVQQVGGALRFARPRTDRDQNGARRDHRNPVGVYRPKYALTDFALNQRAIYYGAAQFRLPRRSVFNQGSI